MADEQTPPRRSLPLSQLRKNREESVAASLDRKIASTPTWGGQNGTYAIPRREQRPAALPSRHPVNNDSKVVEETVEEEVTTPSEQVQEEIVIVKDESIDTPVKVTPVSSSVRPVSLPRVSVSSREKAPVDRASTLSSEQVVSAPVVPAAFVSSEEWEDDTVIEREEQRRKWWSGGSGFRVVPRDIEILRFLGRYRYAQTTQVARYIGTSSKATQIRLSKMGKVNLVRREDITSGQAVWTPTAAGLAVADLDIRVIGEGQISLVTMAHTLGLINIGIELEKGGSNLLGEDGWPFSHRLNEDTGELEVGEHVLTEREISQGQNRWKKQKERGQLRSIVEGRLEEWEEAGRSTPSPEMSAGNEGMFVLYSTAKTALSGSGEHVPDMVIVRPRDDEGNPYSVAIELELQSKPTDEWRRILRAYKASAMYGKLVYFTHKPAIRNALIKINEEEVGIEPGRFEVRKYIPASGRQPFWG